MCNEKTSVLDKAFAEAIALIDPIVVHEGRRAFREGLSSFDNPYQRNSPRSRSLSWDMGWLAEKIRQS